MLVSVLDRSVELDLRAHHKRLIRECEATYDELAPDYDRHLRDECDYRSPEHVAAELARLGASGRWLDLGAGTGLVGEALVDRGVDLCLVAIDVSAAMLAKIVCPLYAERYHADVLRHLPVERHSCDGVVAAGLMEYIIDPARFVRQVARVVASGGWFVFTFCPNNSGCVEPFDEETDLHCHDGELVERCLEDAGFRIDGREEFPAYVNGDQGWIDHRMLIARRGS